MHPKASKRVDAVMKIANDIAREFDQEYVGTEHVLLAILREGTGLGASVLAKRGLDEAAVRREVEKLVKKSMEETWVFGRLPGTPHFKNVIASAIEQCHELDAREVSTEHLLLALLKERGCVAHKALSALGITHEGVRKDLLALAAVG